MSTVLVLHDYLEVLWCLAMYEGFVTQATELPTDSKASSFSVFISDKMQRQQTGWQCCFIIHSDGNEIVENAVRVFAFYF